MEKKAKKVLKKKNEKDREVSTDYCYYVDPCGCYNYFIDPCGCRQHVNPCCC